MSEKIAGWIVFLYDNDQGFQDQTFLGVFRSKDKAVAFEEKVRARIKYPEMIRVSTQAVHRPTLRNVAEAGDWFDGPDDTSW